MCKTRDQIDLYITKIPAVMQSGSKQTQGSVWGSAGGARDSEWAKERREKGEGQIPGEQISHRSHSICVIRKKNNGFR